MPLDDRDYMRGEHPPTCTCEECCAKRSNNSSPKIVTICPKCNQNSLWYNGFENTYECLNPKCKVRGKTIEGIRGIQTVIDIAEQARSRKQTKKTPNKLSASAWTPVIIVVIAVLAGTILAIVAFRSRPPTIPTISRVADTPISTHTPISTTNPVPSSSPVPPPSAKSKYTNFHNDLAGYSIDYPSSWQAIGATGVHTTFADTRNTSTIVDVMLQRGDYQSVFLNLAGKVSEIPTKVQVRQNNLINYSLFSQFVGSKYRSIYICDLNPFILIFNCDFQTKTEAESSFAEINDHALYMMLSFQLDHPELIAKPSVPVITLTSPIPKPQSPPAGTIKPSPSPTTKNATTPQSISVNNGVYGEYYLGLVNTPGGIIGGQGCYDNTGDFIILINNKNATNPTYNQLTSFLQQNKTDQFPYQFVKTSPSLFYGSARSKVNLGRIQEIIDGNESPSPPKMCGDFAERLHNDSEMARIKCAYVHIDLNGYPDPDHYGISSNSGHALNAFQTSDRGLIYIVFRP